MPTIGSNRFYRDLAEKLRGLGEVRTARADAEREASVAEGGVPLAQMLDLLTSDEGADTARSLLVQAERACSASDVELGLPRGWGDVATPAGEPLDKFDRALGQWFKMSWLTDGGRPLPAQVPKAVVEAFAGVCGQSGVVSEAAAARLGPAGLRAFQLIRDRLSALDGPPESRADASKYEFLGPLTVQLVGRSRALSPAKDRMPVLDDITSMLGGPHALQGFKMASVQHLFPSTRGL